MECPERHPTNLWIVFILSAFAFEWWNWFESDECWLMTTTTNDEMWQVEGGRWILYWTQCTLNNDDILITEDEKHLETIFIYSKKCYLFIFWELKWLDHAFMSTFLENVRNSKWNEIKYPQYNKHWLWTDLFSNRDDTSNLFSIPRMKMKRIEERQKTTFQSQKTKKKLKNYEIMCSTFQLDWRKEILKILEQVKRKL